MIEWVRLWQDIMGLWLWTVFLYLRYTTSPCQVLVLFTRVMLRSNGCGDMPPFVGARFGAAFTIVLALGLTFQGLLTMAIPLNDTNVSGGRSDSCV